MVVLDRFYCINAIISAEIVALLKALVSKSFVVSCELVNHLPIKHRKRVHLFHVQYSENKRVRP